MADLNQQLLDFSKKMGEAYDILSELELKEPAHILARQEMLDKIADIAFVAPTFRRSDANDTLSRLFTVGS